MFCPLHLSFLPQLCAMGCMYNIHPKSLIQPHRSFRGSAYCPVPLPSIQEITQTPLSTSLWTGIPRLHEQLVALWKRKSQLRRWWKQQSLMVFRPRAPLQEAAPRSVCAGSSACRSSPGLAQRPWASPGQPRAHAGHRWLSCHVWPLYYLQWDFFFNSNNNNKMLRARPAQSGQ